MMDERHTDAAVGTDFKHMQQLDLQINRLTDHIDGIEEQLQPILERRQPIAEVEAEEKLAEPVHDLHSAIVRFEDANRRLDKLRSRIRL